MSAPARPFVARLEEARDLSPTVRHLVFERVDGAASEFAPGQFHNLFFDLPSGEIRRSYSIASAPEGTPRFELAVTRVPNGPASEALHAMVPGHEVRVVGPHGLFTRAGDEARPALFVGTGAGIAPLRSMWRAAARARSKVKLGLLFGVRSEHDILYRDELEGLREAIPGFDARVTLSRPSSAWSGRTGYVQAHLAEAYAALGDPDAHVFICGLDKMVSEVRDLCRNTLGIPRKQVHQERYD